MTMTTGTSICDASIPKAINEVMPKTPKIRKVTIVGTGFLIDQDEKWKDILQRDKG